MSETNKPVMKHKAGAFATAVFQNKGKKQDGTEFEYKSIVLQRSYNKGTQDAPDWQNEHLNLRISDLAKVIALLQDVNNKLVVSEEKQ